MNKYQEALKKMCDGCEYSPFIGECSFKCPIKEELKELVEKATPKKPTVHCSGYFNGMPIYDEYSCPSCSARVDDTDHHCKCGQALDWSEEE